MKIQLLLIASLAIITTAHAQTAQYTRIETARFDRDGKPKTKTIKYEGGTVDVEGQKITIDKEAPRPTYYTIASIGSYEPQDEGYSSRQYIGITETNKGKLKALKIVLFYTPKKELCDLVVKDGSKNIDYCIK